MWLQTPKRCFERAAEKCHMDTLDSIVATCSWGKHVAVGTGSRFDILWDTREVVMNYSSVLVNLSYIQLSLVGYWNFPNMISTTFPGGIESRWSGCL